VNPGAPALVVDVHSHLVGIDRDTHGCVLGAAMRKKISTRSVLKLVGASLDEPALDVDRKYADFLRAQLDKSPSVDRVVLYAFDGVYKDDGSLDEARTSLLVPNDYAFEVAATHPKIWVGASVNPYRRDAIAELERCVARGAVLLKWIPSAMGFDPADARCEPFLKRVAALGLPLVSHVGTEFAIACVDSKLGALERLERALELGVKVIIPHGGDLKFLGDAADWERICSLLERHPRAHLDLAALSLVHRRRRLFRILEREQVHGRVLHGSDFPLPVHAWAFAGRIGVRRARELGRIESIFERDFALKKELGVPDAFFTRANGLLRLPTVAVS
jgi:predicted TIM-barrel fold metal-dependent hydrolase